MFFIYKAWNWLSGKSGGENQDIEDGDSPVGEVLGSQSRKPSFHHGKQKVQKSVSKQASKPANRTFADRIGIKKKKKKEPDHDSQIDDYIYENSDDLDTITKDEELLYFKVTKIVPRIDLKLGMSRFTFLLDTCCPGSIPDPLLLAAVLDMVSSGGNKMFRKKNNIIPLGNNFHSGQGLFSSPLCTFNTRVQQRQLVGMDQAATTRRKAG